MAKKKDVTSGKNTTMLTASFEKDTPKKHRYQLSDHPVISGTLYAVKGEDMPDEIVIKVEKK